MQTMMAGKDEHPKDRDVLRKLEKAILQAEREASKQRSNIRELWKQVERIKQEQRKP